MGCGNSKTVNRKKITILHVMEMSGNSHGCMLLVRTGKLEVKIKNVDLMKGEHKTEEFLKINPYHIVPTLSQGEDSLWESNAVMRYLCTNYEAVKKYYPTEDTKKFAKINQMLDYRQTVLYPKVTRAGYPLLGFSSLAHTEEVMKAAADEIERFGKLYLADGKFVGGFQEPTIADISIITILSYIEGKKDYKYPKAVQEWIERFNKAFPEYMEVKKSFVGYLEGVVWPKQTTEKKE